MTRRQYTVAEVENLIPTLEGIFTQILQLRVGLRGIERKLERAGVTIEVDEESEDEMQVASRSSQGPEAPDVRHARAVFRGFYEALSDGLEQIRTLGGEVKDLDMGLVDFPGRRGADDILLCWRLGEKRIEFWHPVDGGFANRRPLDEGISRTPSQMD
ncbi:MAG: DUF2203 domain-containing protein [Deltaproteobacteria bacterium]|nr:DUF2203 domain-containing protein [Deltaproteobacteria bacterium]